MLTLNKMFVILIRGKQKQAIKGKCSLKTGEKYGKNKTKIFIYHGCSGGGRHRSTHSSTYLL